MPHALSSPRPLVDAVLGTAREWDCWELLAYLYKAGWEVDIMTDTEALPRAFVEVWFQGDRRDPLPVLRPWDCLIFSMKGLVGDHCGVVLDTLTFVHARSRTGVIIDRIHRWHPKLLQVARLRQVA